VYSREGKTVSEQNELTDFYKSAIENLFRRAVPVLNTLGELAVTVEAGKTSEAPIRPRLIAAFHSKRSGIKLVFDLVLENSLIPPGDGTVIMEVPVDDLKAEIVNVMMERKRYAVWEVCGVPGGWQLPEVCKDDRMLVLRAPFKSFNDAVTYIQVFLRFVDLLKRTEEALIDGAISSVLESVMKEGA